MTRLFAAISQWSTLLPAPCPVDGIRSCRLPSNLRFRYKSPIQHSGLPESRFSGVPCAPWHTSAVARQAYLGGIFIGYPEQSRFQIKGNTLTGKEIAQAAVQRKVLGSTDSYAVHLVHQPYFVRYLQGQFQVVSRKENRLVRLPAELVKQLHHLYFTGKIKESCRFIQIDDGSFLGERLAIITFCRSPSLSVCTMRCARWECLPGRWICPPQSCPLSKEFPRNRCRGYAPDLSVLRRTYCVYRTSPSAPH